MPAWLVTRTERIEPMRKSGTRQHLLLGLALCVSQVVMGQTKVDTLAGEVSYMSSQNVYVRFPTTRDITEGDTLYRLSEMGLAESALIVKYLSSTSCVGIPLPDQVFEKGMKILALKRRTILAEPEETAEDLHREISTEEEIPDEVPVKEKVTKPRGELPKGRIKGRITAASYSTMSGQQAQNRQRLRYTMTLNVERIGNSAFSVESYMAFRHTIYQWQEVQDHFKRTFKIFNLALRYDANEATRIWIGRKINPNISNIGAIDGVQAEKKWNRFLTGAFAGSRPDHTDYGFNFNLVQYGAYAGYTTEGKQGSMQTTMAFAEQRNGQMTDRRFAYIQHFNSAIRRIHIFTSFEFDLYTLENLLPKNTINLSSAYFSLRYRVSDKLSLFGSYDARKNIIYYETYRHFIDQLLEDETRQGLRFSFNYRPLKRITLGSNAGYRFQKNNLFPSKNLNTYLTISRIPKLQIGATLSATLLQTPYLDGFIYGIRISRDLIKGKVYGELQYRKVEYQYRNVEVPIQQSIAGVQLSWRVTKKLSMACNYEGELYKNQLNQRLYANLIRRF